MHTMVVTRDLAEREREIVTAVYRGFCQAKDAMAIQLVQGMTFNNMVTMLPWLTSLIEADRDVLGDDWWPYGVQANAAAIDAVLRYHHEQGITKRRFKGEEIFAPYLLDT